MPTPEQAAEWAEILGLSKKVETPLDKKEREEREQRWKEMEAKIAEWDAEKFKKSNGASFENYCDHASKWLDGMSETGLKLSEDYLRESYEADKDAESAAWNKLREVEPLEDDPEIVARNKAAADMMSELEKAAETFKNIAGRSSLNNM